ncbi:hypothetical protein GCM10027051_18320 [Niabella terrae]
MSKLLHMKLMALLFCIASFSAIAQNPKHFKFGKISASDFDVRSPVIDTGTTAVILADIGESKIEGNNNGFFSLVYTHTRRIKILNKNGFDAADVSIVLYNSPTSEEKLTTCKAYTYNLENGKVEETKLDNSNIFKEKVNRNYMLRKFTFPNVKEGSIIEYTYTVNSEFLTHLRPWEFQGASWPRIYSRYTVNIPQFFDYVFLSQGYVKTEMEKDATYKSYSVSTSQGAGATEHYSLSGNENEVTWTALNVPALKEEPFTSSIENHLTKIDFQLKSIQFPNMPAEQYMGTWAKAAEELLKREDFGMEITRPNNWLNDEVETIVGTAATSLEKARLLYAYVRDHFTATTESGIFINDNTRLKDVFRKKSGNIAEINLLLIAMLRTAGLPADPVLISTRSHGWANPYYPLITKFNYLLCQTNIDGQNQLLDATGSKMGFGRLSPQCYNGTAFLVRPNPANFDLAPDSLREAKSTLIFLINDPEGGMKGSFTSTPGYYESTQLRKRLVKENIKDLVKESIKTYSFPLTTYQEHVDSLDKYDYPVALKYNLHFDTDDQDMIYLNPMFSEGTTKNPFTSAERNYPVEMPYKLSETYVLSMDIPSGYKVEEHPKSARVNLNNGEGSFEYYIDVKENKILLTSRINIKKTQFSSEDYQTLRDFFGYITKKHSEVVVLKKI